METAAELFQTPRLVARRLTRGDVPAMLAIYGDLETVRLVADAEPLTLAECERWIEVTDANFERRGYGMVAFTDRETGELIGCGGIVHPDQQPEAEAKYAFRRDHWGLGLATEALSALVRHAFAAWGRTELIATVHPENGPSQRVLGKVGFVHDVDRVNDDGSITQVWRASPSTLKAQ